jgi:1-acyl-sn-glycerol-3-phosphate acyltransferase
MPDDFDSTLVLELSQLPFGRFFRDLPIKYFDATIDGVEHVPKDSGVLLVGNHAMFGLDGYVLGSLLLRETSRVPRFLGERNLWRVPGLAQLLTGVGALPGEPKRAVELLAAGELVIVYPGGVDDSFKKSSQRYVLQWGTRAGFAKVAMRAKVPIVPVVGEGIDEMYAIRTREQTLGRLIFGSERYDIPLARGALGTLLPRRVKQSFHLLEPIDTSGDPERPEDLERVRAATYDALEARLSLLRATVR